MRGLPPLALLLAVGGDLAWGSPASTAPRIDAEAIGLEEAVQLTLAHDAQIGLARQDVAGAAGLADTARGRFDPVFFLEPSYTQSTNEVFPFVRELERQKREVLSTVSSVFTAASDRLRRQLERFDLTAPPCPSGNDLEDLVQSDPLAREDRARQSGLLPENVVINFGGLEDDLEAALQLCTPVGETGLDLDDLLNLFEDMDASDEVDLSDTLSNAEQLQRERIALTQNVFDLVGTKTGLAFQRLGDIPRDEVTKTWALDSSLFKPFRSGIDWSLDLRLESTERNFVHKSLDPVFGGFGIPNQFPSFFSTSLTFPLGKGGSQSVRAPELASQDNLEAQREILRHTMASEVASTMLAYFELAAAQQSVAVLQESADRQRRIVETTQTLMETGDAAATDVARANARLASVLGSVANGERRVLAARLSLADAVGIAVEEANGAPLAAEPLDPEPASIPSTATLVDLALHSRRDLQGQERLREAAATLADGARADLKHQIDLFVTGGISTLYTSPLFHDLPSELETPPEESAVRNGDPLGYWRSLEGTWDPFVSVGLSMRFPFKNNAARGRLVQELATLGQNEIQYTDTERVIRDNVVSEVTAVDRARREVERHQTAVGHLDETLLATLQLFEDGEADLIDTLTTEDQLTSEKLLLIRALQVYHSLIARLRFETGSILDFQGEGTGAEAATFDPRPFGKPSG